jgi:hypothetical protein
MQSNIPGFREKREDTKEDTKKQHKLRVGKFGFRSSGMWHCVAGCVVSDVSKERHAFISKN